MDRIGMNWYKKQVIFDVWFSDTYCAARGSVAENIDEEELF